MVMQLIAGLVAILQFSTVGFAGQREVPNSDVFQVLHCNFQDFAHRFSIEAEMTDFDRFVPHGYYISHDNRTRYSLTQETPGHGELFRLVLNQEVPVDALRVRVRDSKAGLAATATFLGGKPPTNKVDGTCFYF